MRPGYNVPMSAGLDTLKSALPRESWTEDTGVIAPYLVEWRDKYFGKTPLMLMPADTGEVQTAVKICSDHDIKIVPQGGNTGLVGGQIPRNEVLLLTKHLDKIRSVNPATHALIAEAGVTLLAVQEAAKAAGRKFPLSLASEGSCTIGGNLSTNAGGMHVLKYGTAKDLVFGVEAVLPNGDIFNGLTDLRKDNTGYDLSRLFLGAEGTLGIITAASLKLFPQPLQIQRVMVGITGIADALALLDRCRVGEALAMFEVMPRKGIELVVQHIPGMRDPFTDAHPWYALIDWEVGDSDMGLSIAESVIGAALQEGLVNDAVIAQSETQASNLLMLREHMSAAQKPYGASIKFDITIPIDRIPDFMDVAYGAVQKTVPGCEPFAFGHLGDGNIHYDVFQPENMDKDAYLEHWPDMSEAVFDVVDCFDGSISAEHGIGVMKKDDLAKRADPIKITMLRAIKKTFDPKNIMNPRVLV